jgi:type III pantothenate kinase
MPPATLLVVFFQLMAALLFSWLILEFLMKNICIDFGNTFSKIGYFNGDKLQEYLPKIESNQIIKVCQKYDYEQIMICSVTKNVDEIEKEFSVLGKNINILTPHTLLPIQKNYETPETLGADRLAAAVGAASIFPNENTLIIDMGTCIKYDLVEKGIIFQGGIIAPGLKMRFKAMHVFTKKLPLIESYEPWPNLIGKNTIQAMQSGVLNGILAEMDGIIDQYSAQLTKFKIILCGGDATLFESRLKYPTFVVPELVPIGLNRILLYNLNN